MKNNEQKEKHTYVSKKEMHHNQSYTSGKTKKNYKKKFTFSNFPAKKNYHRVVWAENFEFHIEKFGKNAVLRVI